MKTIPKRGAKPSKTLSRSGNELGIKVTRIGKQWIAVLTVGSKERDRMACKLKSDIGWMCREMLRWYDKLGGNSAWAASARRRQKGSPIGKVWHNPS